jgi:hypothetical protein
MAILQNAFKGTAGLGLMVVPENPDNHKKYLELLRSDYEKALGEARQFFLEEKLFIPMKIAECAESTLGAAIKEKNFYDIFSKHYESTVRSQYTKILPGCLDDFNAGMTALEKLMREYIEGKRLSLLTSQI